MKRTLLAALVTVIAAPASAQAPLITGLGGPLDFGTSALPRGNEDTSLTPVDLTTTFPSGIDFYGQHVTSVFVNMNGTLTFGAAVGAVTLTSFPRATGGPPMIAAWWGDVDTTDALATEPDGNQVFYAATATQFVATWIDVGYFDRHVDLLNAFQIVLTPAAGGPTGAFDVELRYHRCEWLMGDGGAMPAQAGLDASDGMHSVSLPGSGTAAMLGLCATGNVDPSMPGIWHLHSVVPTPTCGNGLRETGESCDDGNRGDHDFCSNLCAMRTPCIGMYPDGAIDFPFPLPDVGPPPDANGADATGGEAAGGLPFIDATLPRIDANLSGLDGAVIPLCPGDDAGRADGGRRPDAGTRFDAGTGLMDSGGRMDGGRRPNELDVTGGGCGCRAGARRGGGSIALLALLALALRRVSRMSARARGATRAAHDWRPRVD